ncbi:helix-turn-helix domain-containing protein [Altererythrobacter xixiisoli]|uniref:Helix-turn-helix domain-containing protein n=1 Tax=Croceibacterium xixiisoli TaxID=1476466 RepID=A0A6I4TXP1_9SPHN|nr:helix-turn-helix transcriptional regulator [Croceibacterium xixiisoli]MXP00797.1 helix-turn-helix domain-containing protein [Croceibacterium xixiisoli]
MARNNLVELRKRLNLSQSDVAEAIGTTLNNYGKIERGTRRLNETWIDKLAVALQVQPHELFVADIVRRNLPSSKELSRMIARAMAELPVGVTFEDYPEAVASSLHAQLTQYQAAGGFRDDADQASGLDKDV